jgi:hypothetical protein
VETPVEPKIEHPDETLENSISLDKRLKEVEKHIKGIMDSNKVEPEEAVLFALAQLEYIAKRAIAIRSGQPRGAILNLRQSSAGAILSLDTDDAPVSTPTKQTAKPATPKSDDLPSPRHLSQLAKDLLEDEKVFISPTILSKYVDLQRLLGRAHAIPEILHLYAVKPVPVAGSSPPVYKQVSPKNYKQAVPGPIAEKAISAAIAEKDMPLALSMIDVTYNAPAWRNRKWITKFTPPFAAVCAIPFLCMRIASELSLYSGYIDEWRFKVYCFLGFMTYFTCTGTLGFVALTTYNDHHERVVWRPGTPLLERWMREEERAALDRIAIAWGFKELWKRGDEEGEDWEGLRQWCFLRNMYLDKPELMPGMNPPTTGDM